MDRNNIKGLLEQNKLAVFIVVGFTIGLVASVSYFGTISSLQPGQITGVDCANVTLPDDYCDGTTFYHDPVCEGDTITFDITPDSIECGYEPPEAENVTEEPTEEPTEAATEEVTPTPTPTATEEPEPEPTSTPTPVPTAVEIVEPTPEVEVIEEEEPSIINVFLQNIRDNIFKYLKI